MSFMSVHDAEFWEHCPPSLKHVQRDFTVRRKPGTAMAYFLLGSEHDDTPAIGALRLAPGEVVTRHRHSSYRVEVVISGSLQVVGGPLLHAGDVMMTPPDEPYGPHIAGPDGAITFEIMSNHRATCHPTLETPDGPVPYDITTEEGWLVFVEAGMKVAMEAAAKAEQAAAAAEH